MNCNNKAMTNVDIDSGAIDGVTIATSDITVGAKKTLDVSAGTLTLANDQISGDAINGGTIGSITISQLEGAMNCNNKAMANVDINSGAIDGVTIATSDITVGAKKTLDVSAGTLTLANDQISGDAINGGTIGSITISQLEGAMNCNNKAMANVDINSGAIDGATIGGSNPAAITGTTVTADTIQLSNVNDGNLSTIKVDPAETGNILIDPYPAAGNIAGKVIIYGDLQVKGTQTTVNSTIVVTDESQIILGNLTTPSNQLSGAGLKFGQTSNNLSLLYNGSDAITCNGAHFNLNSGKEYKIANNGVLKINSDGSSAEIPRALKTVSLASNAGVKGNLRVRSDFSAEININGTQYRLNLLPPGAVVDN